MSDIVRRGEARVYAGPVPEENDLLVVWELRQNGSTCWVEGEVQRREDPLLSFLVTRPGRWEFETVGACDMWPNALTDSLEAALGIAREELGR